LILSDINMPGMTGLEMLPKMKEMRPDVPVIMITAYGDGFGAGRGAPGECTIRFTMLATLDFLGSALNGVGGSPGGLKNFARIVSTCRNRNADLATGGAKRCPKSQRSITTMMRARTN
jgi:chemotaxis response regulator CheB